MSREEHGRWLPGSFLDLLPGPERALALRLGRSNTVGPDTDVIRHGDSSQDVFLIVDGHAKITGSTPEGHEVVLALRGPGDILGELAAIDGGVRSATVTSLDEVTLRGMSESAFKRFLGDYEAAMNTLTKVVTGRLRLSNERRLEMGAYAVPIRLARILLWLGDGYGVDTDQGRQVELQLTQLELAGLVGASLESIVKSLVEFRRRELVSTGRERLVIRDEAGLARVAQPADGTRSFYL